MTERLNDTDLLDKMAEALDAIHLCDLAAEGMHNDYSSPLVMGNSLIYNPVKLALEELKMRKTELGGVGEVRQ